MKPVIAITVGDFNGIGPEIALKALQHPAVRNVCRPLLIGPPEAFLYYQERFSIPLRLSPAADPVPPASRAGTVYLYTPSAAGRVTVHPGRISARAGLAAAQAIEAATALVLSGTASAMVTAPVSKHALHSAGFDFPGQTEMLRQLTHSAGVAMMLVSHRMKVGLVTIHLPLRRVAREITRTLVHRKVCLIHQALVQDWRIRYPRIALLGLNPHAGEEGDLGTEESRSIMPAVRQLQRSGIRCKGPFPADGFFARYDKESWDAVVAMYHDQGLIPLKQTAEGKAVNYSAGLNVVRTSPGHGTAMDIAGKGIASPESMVEAILLAATIARNRQYHAQRSRR